MDLRINYEPLEWQRAVHECPDENLSLVGGLGCVRESSAVLTYSGFRAIGEITEGTLVWSWTDKGFRLSPSTCAFPKGRENLYRVVHERGEFVAAAHHRVFCADYKYRPVEELFSCNQYSHTLLSTTEEFSQKELPSDVHCWIEKLLGFLDRYAIDIHRYDLLLQSLRVFAVTQFPSRACAQENDPLLDRFQELLCSHPVLSNDQISMLHFVYRVESPPLNEVDYISEKPSERALGEVPGLQRFRSSFVVRRIIERWQCVLDSSLRLTSHKSAIQSIERLPKAEWFFDIQVANTHNYICGGSIHHNSGKTTVAIRELQALAIQNPGFTYLIGRKTMPSLRDTAMKSFFGIVEDGFIKEHNKTHNDVKIFNGAEFIFRGLDDLEKLKSLEIAGFFVNEANEIDQDLYNTLKSRVRQRIGGRPPSMYRSIIDLNPTDETHWIPQLFLHKKPPNHKMFFSNTLQNEKHLPAGYVQSLLDTYTPDMIQRMVYGLFGKVHKGLPVFSQFARNVDYYQRRLEPVEGAPIFVGMDFGFNHPAWVWLQFIDGQARVLAEKMGSKIYLQDFIPECQEYAKSLWGFWKPGYKYFCDPRGSDSSDKGKTSVEICNEFGIHPIYRRTFIDEGIRAMKYLMDRKVLNDPGFLIHHRCALLIEGLAGGYHRLDGEDSPVKDGYYDHMFDSLRYAIIHLTRRFRSNSLQAQMNADVGVYISKVSGRRIET